MFGEYRVKCGQNFQSKNFGQNFVSKNESGQNYT